MGSGDMGSGSGSGGEDPVNMGSGSGSEDPVDMGSGSGSEDPVTMGPGSGSGSGSGSSSGASCPEKVLMEDCNINCSGTSPDPSTGQLFSSQAESKDGLTFYKTSWTILADNDAPKITWACETATFVTECKDGGWTIPQEIADLECGMEGHGSGSGDDGMMDHGSSSGSEDDGMMDHGSSSGSGSEDDGMMDHGSGNDGMMDHGSGSGSEDDGMMDHGRGNDGMMD